MIAMPAQHDFGFKYLGVLVHVNGVTPVACSLHVSYCFLWLLWFVEIISTKVVCCSWPVLSQPPSNPNINHYTPVPHTPFYRNCTFSSVSPTCFFFSSSFDPFSSLPISLFVNKCCLLMLLQLSIRLQQFYTSSNLTPSSHP